MREKYLLQCPGCGRPFPDRYTLDCPSGCDALLRTVYAERRLVLRDLPGIFRYIEWLPVEGHLRIDAGPVSYGSVALARELGLSHLTVTFSGYWPERGGRMETCSFKELEAQPTLLRLREKGAGVIQVSSAGNTGRAFCQASALTGAPVVVVVPASAAGRLWTTVPSPNVCLITVDGDYSDSIAFGREVCSLPGIVPEGGAKNVARRDGMGTVMLDGALAAGRLPDYYFQAVGSGTGGIAAWEAAERLIADGRFGSRLPELHLSQNLPFVPMVRAWGAGRREIVPAEDMPDAESSIARVSASVLTNRHPPWGIRGGVYDALAASGGRMYAVANDEAQSARRLFADTEGIDLDPAAAVAVASLVRAVEEGLVGPDDHILLNVTGGGYERAAEELDRYPVEPYLRVRAGEAFEGDVRDAVRAWFAEQGVAIRA
ncbi:MAG: cysteate synthase [Methanoculleus sp.]|uniref:cysteate synthase n=1 Tax=unclassified Methanoculleus TaxID=2619537 RepID=UPI0025FDB1A9|nr:MULTISPECIES: cysteate synthase [unclassified Methanoculleus]MCK9317986.1 cysteate synthase [Methanoculleus sp.]MDD2254082.1 cysteate synthase [Methanoculleus sp.]MDD3215359.1 cysteate synthase [Methanoculleus sp.]MDD4314316.1 cysteate synthase [Methanoculleus sp.]MDD4470601.1 cysteate synthase [Methanoculleus sp.]